MASAAALLLLTTSVLADIVQDTVLRSVQAGIICPPEPVAAVPAPGTLAGSTHIIDIEPQFVSTTQRVPATLGVGFGVKSLSAAIEGIEDVKIILTHPPMGSQNATTQTFQTRISGVDAALTFYQFDYAYELVQGAWHFTAMSGDTLLYSVAFEVVDPREAPELAGVCGHLELLS